MVFNEETEHYMAFYDIFVRHAFGSYLWEIDLLVFQGDQLSLLPMYYLCSCHSDILKEISHNVIMGSWLSFINNKSLQYNIDEFEQDAYPDENFAREIM